MNNNNFYDYNEPKNLNFKPEGEPCSCYKPGPKPTPPCPPSDQCYIVGNSISFSIDKCDKEIKADITVNSRESVRIWGQIKDCTGKPVPYAYVKLVRLTPNGMMGVAHTITDCLGLYQFDVCPCTDGYNFTVLVGKAIVGGERVVSVGPNDGANCNPCAPIDCKPCLDPCKK